jgi:hypothetical protein
MAGWLRRGRGALRNEEKETTADFDPPLVFVQSEGFAVMNVAGL